MVLRVFKVIPLLLSTAFIATFLFASPAHAETTATSTVLPAVAQNPYQVEGIPGTDEPLGDFVVGPGKIELNLKPGESRTVEVLVTNRTGTRHIFNLTTEDAEGSDDANVAVKLLGNERGPYSIKDYISVPQKSFELDTNQRARIPVTISIPADAEPGGLYGSLLVDTVAVDAKPGDASAGTAPQSAIVARIGTLFFVTIPGATTHDLSLKEFGTLQKQTFFQQGPISFGILNENKGSVHEVPYGELRIRNIFGEEVGYTALDPWFVLPKSVRLREVAWNRDYLFGRYTATVSLHRGYDEAVDTASFTFWVLPWKPIALGFAGLFIIVFLFRSFFKRFEFKRRD